MARRFQARLVGGLLTGAIIAVLVIAYFPLRMAADKFQYETVEGGWYWSTVLHGWGEEVTQDNNAVYFYRIVQGGRWRCRATHDDIESARVESARAYVDRWLLYRTDNNGDLLLDAYARAEFRMLTGSSLPELSSPVADQQPMPEVVRWWEENKASFNPTWGRLMAYRHMRMAHNSLWDNISLEDWYLRRIPNVWRPQDAYIDPADGGGLWTRLNDGVEGPTKSSTVTTLWMLVFDAFYIMLCVVTGVCVAPRGKVRPGAVD